MAEQRSTLIIEISSEQAARNARALDRELQSIERTGNYATTSMNSMSVAARQLAGYLAGVVTVGTAIAKMDDWTNLNNRLRLVTTSQKALNVAMQDTFDIAQRSGAAWGGTATIYQKIQYNSEKLGLSQEKVAKITESISKSISNSGSSAQAASAALYQLGQSFDKSSLNGDEFVSMSENAGYLMEVFAKGLGVTRAELKEMSSQGLLTTDKMVQAIEKMSGSIEEDFGKTNFTIGQSFTQLSNAVTKFVGESGQATGAASAISSSLSSLAENLNTVTNIAMIGGAYWVGTYIPALYTSTMAGYGKIKQLVEQTVIQYAAVQAEKVAAAQELAGAEAKLVNLQATRAQLVEELKLELARKKKQISDKGAINSELRMGLLRQQQAAINVELTATENALAAARTRSATAATATLGIGSRILGVMTGPVGIGISIAAVAAGYLLMRDSTAEANKKLEEQTEIASRTKQELLALQGVQKKGAKADLQDAFKGQNKELKDLNYLFNAHIIELQNAYRGNLQIVEISNKVRQGMMSQEDALKRLNKLDFISPDQLKQLQKDNDLYREKLPVVQRVKEALKVFGIDAELAGNKATNASKGVNDIAKEAITTSEKVKGLSEEIQKFISSSLSSSLQNEERLKLYNQGLSKESADIILKAREAAGIVGTDQQLPLGTLAILGRELLTTTEIKKVEDERNKSEQERTKELKEQLKTQQRLIGISGNSGIGTGAHLDVRYGGSRDGQKVSAEHIARLQAGGKSLSSYRVSSDYGQRKAPTAGASSFHKGIDFAMPVGTPITTKVAVKDVKTAYDSKGGGYYSTVTFEDGVVLKLLHQSPSMQSKVKGGASTGTYGSYIAQDKAEAKSEQEIETLRANYYSLGEKDEADHIKRVKDLRKNGLDSLIADENTRFEKTKQLRQFEFTMEVDGWRWVGEEKIKNDAYVKKLRVEASTDFNKKEKAEAIQSFEEQRDLELAAYRRLQKDKLDEFKAALEQQTGELQRAYYEVMAQNTMTQPQLAQWQFQNQYGSSIGGAYDSYQNSVKDINKRDDKDQYLIDAEKRNERLIAAQKNLETQLLLIKAKGVEDEKVLHQQAYDSQMGLYGNMLSTAGSTWSGYTDLIKKTEGENSATYKSMFIVQQLMAAAQAIIYGNLASAAALAPPPIGLGPVAGMALSGLMRANGYASAALIGTQTIAGFASGGHITGKGTGTSDDIPIWASNGEFMLKASAVSRIGLANLEYMNKTGDLPHNAKYAEGGMIRQPTGGHNGISEYLARSKGGNSQPIVNVLTLPGTTAQVSTGSDGSLDIRIQEVAERVVTGQLRNPNSQISKSVQQNTTATRRR